MLIECPAWRLHTIGLLDKRRATADDDCIHSASAGRPGTRSHTRSIRNYTSRMALELLDCISDEPSRPAARPRFPVRDTRPALLIHARGLEQVPSSGTQIKGELEAAVQTVGSTIHRPTGRVVLRTDLWKHVSCHSVFPHGVDGGVPAACRSQQPQLHRPCCRLSRGLFWFTVSECILSKDIQRSALARVKESRTSRTFFGCGRSTNTHRIVDPRMVRPSTRLPLATNCGCSVVRIWHSHHPPIHKPVHCRLLRDSFQLGYIRSHYCQIAGWIHLSFVRKQAVRDIRIWLGQYTVSIGFNSSRWTAAIHHMEIRIATSKE
jgi:hypothetical protein